MGGELKCICYINNRKIGQVIPVEDIHKPVCMKCNKPLEVAKMSLYQQVIAKGIKHDNHESDLYIPYTEENMRMVKEADWSVSMFTNQVEGGTWLDLPFAYDPFWEAKPRG